MALLSALLLCAISGALIATYTLVPEMESGITVQISESKIKLSTEYHNHNKPWILLKCLTMHQNLQKCTSAYKINTLLKERICDGSTQQADSAFYSLSENSWEAGLQFDCRGMIRTVAWDVTRIGESPGMKLKTLQLQDNDAPTSEQPLLGFLSQLVFLDLSHNFLTDYILSREFISQLSHLRKLMLADNLLTRIPIKIENLTSLEYLDLSRNCNMSYSEITVSKMDSLTNLKFLNLSRTNLQTFSNLSPFLSTIRLITLDVSFCNITRISHNDAEVLKNQILLQYFHLSGNKIVNHAGNLFEPLKSLKILNLSSVGWTVAPNLTLNKSCKLEELNLSNNSLTELKDVIFSGCVHHLRIPNNKIKFWNETNLFSKTCIRKLDLSFNEIPYITKVMGQSMLSLEEIELSSNPFQCNSSCQTVDFRNWVSNITNSNATVKLMKQLSCEYPENERGKNILETDVTCPKNDSNPMIISTSIVILLLFITVIFVIAYRFEVLYIIHLIKIKRLEQSENGTAVRYQYDAFISYSGKDSSWVFNNLIPALENKTDMYRLCLHERDFILGSFISHNIIKAMNESRKMIVILSRNFVSSQYCKWELEMANHSIFMDNREFLIFIQLEQLERSTLPRHLKYLVDTRTYLVWPKKVKSGHIQYTQIWRRLQTALGQSIYFRLLEECSVIDIRL